MEKDRRRSKLGSFMVSTFSDGIEKQVFRRQQDCKKTIVSGQLGVGEFYPE